MKRTPPTPEQIDQLITVVCFLMWLKKADPTALWGGYRIDDAVAALSALTGFTIPQMQKVAYGKEEDA